MRSGSVRCAPLGNNARYTVIFQPLLRPHPHPLSTAAVSQLRRHREHAYKTAGITFHDASIHRSPTTPSHHTVVVIYYSTYRQQAGGQPQEKGWSASQRATILLQKQSIRITLRSCSARACVVRARVSVWCPHPGRRGGVPRHDVYTSNDDKKQTTACRSIS